jgi:hypothetical protein
MKAPLLAPIPKRLVLVGPVWYQTMAILSFELELDQLLVVLVPFIFWDVGDFKNPNELEFVQQVLSILSHFIRGVLESLPVHPIRKGLVSSWHRTMAILLFKLSHFVMLHVPFLIQFQFRHEQQIYFVCLPFFVLFWF